MSSVTYCLPLPSRTGSATAVAMDPDYRHVGRLIDFHGRDQPSNCDGRMQCAATFGSGSSEQRCAGWVASNLHALLGDDRNGSQFRTRHSRRERRVFPL
jgi:hypothetical protein